MQRLLEKHSVGLIISIVGLMVVGYIDMRTLAGSMNDNLIKVVKLAELTRKEQLLRTDEIDYTNQLRGAGALEYHKRHGK